MSLLRGCDVLFVTGGGTAGHIYAGLAVADHWRERHPGTEIHFVGARGGMEERLVPRSPYPLHLVSIGSWNGASACSCRRRSASASMLRSSAEASPPESSTVGVLV